MSYKNTTTHYQWPLPEETDLFNGLDDNQMKEDLDEKIYNLEQRSTGDHEAVTQLNERVTRVEQTVGGYDEQIEQLEGTVGEHAERLVNLTNRQTELSRRLNGKAGEATIAPEYNEEESYSVGDFVYHNNILYKATSASVTPAGEFDADDWDIVILTDELGGSTPTPGTIAAANVSYDDTTRLGAANAQEAIEKLDAKIEAIPTLSGERVVGKLNGANVYEKIYTSATEIAPATTIIDAAINTSTVKYLLSAEGSAQAPGVSNTYITLNTNGVQHSVYTQMTSSGLELRSDVSLKNIAVTYRYIKA